MSLGTIQQEPNLYLLHEFAQHTVYCSAALDVVIDIMAEILGQHGLPTRDGC